MIDRRGVASWAGLLGIAALVVFVARTSLVGASAAADFRARALKCGHDRWDVKTLSDDARGAVDAKYPQVRTIDWLVTRQHGVIHRDTPRIRGFETTVFMVKKVTLVEAKKEPDDNDIHLVIRDDHAQPTHQMIVEFPNVACGVKRFARSVAKARAAIEDYMATCGRRVKGWTQLRGTATIRGVGFFDLPHSTKQHGVADNDAELHPALGFKGSCG
jgi:hypothetical protein